MFSSFTSRLLSASLALTLLSGCGGILEEILESLPDELPEGYLPTDGWQGRVYYADNLEWASNRDLTDAQFADRFDDYVDAGLMIIDVDARTEGGETTFSMVWQDNRENRRWEERRHLTATAFDDLNEQLTGEGLRLLDFEAYTFEGNLVYAAIWIENREVLTWDSVRDMTSSEYADYFDQQSDDGLRPIDIEMYNTPDGLRYAAVWYENRNDVAWSQLRNIDRDRYQQEADDHAADGMMMIDFESLDAGDEQLYAAIWEQPPGSRAQQVRTNRDALGFANLWRTYGDEGYRLVDFENYNAEGASDARYGGVWLENADRFRYSKKADLDADVNSFLANNTLAGMSVAVIHDGELLYRRGFGDADKETGKVASGRTVYGIASVSKVVGGTLAAKLEAEQTLRDGTTFTLDMTQPTADYLTDLPAKHAHDVDQLAAHLGCMPHYQTTPGIADLPGHYETALAAAEDLWDTDLVTGCTIGDTRSYSTHGFTLFGAALEEATGRTIVELLHEELFDAYGLGSMRVQYADATLPANYDRAVFYSDTAGNPLPYEDTSWKVLGGGIESDVVDLARFGWLVLDGQIVDPTTRDDRMWSPVDDEDCTGPGGGTCQNGLGWQLRTLSSRRVADHRGGQDGVRAWLRVWRDDGLVIAVLSNQKSHDPSSMMEAMANTVLLP